MFQQLVERSWLVAPAVMLALIVLEEWSAQGTRPRPGSGRTVTNFTLYAAGLGLVGLIATLVSIWPDDHAVLLVPGFGLSAWLDLSWGAGLAVLVMVDSLFYYCLHRASHRFGLLWRLHAVHHTDRTLDVTTGIRHHPLEALPSLGIQLAAVVLCGATPAQAILVGLGNMAWALCTHAAIGRERRRFRWLGKVLVSPAFHGLHHSCDKRQTDSNYGNTFAVWDWLLGTATDPAVEQPGEIGLGSAHDRDEELLVQLLLPFRRAAP